MTGRKQCLPDRFGSKAEVLSSPARRMGGAKRYPSIAFCRDDGFRGAQPILRTALAMTAQHLNCLCCLKLECRHCEERSDEAIHPLFAARWIASRSLSSGAHSRDPLARNDGSTPELSLLFEI